MDVERKLYIGVVEENIDPRRQGRIKVRVQTLYHKIPVENIPWAAPFGNLAGKSYEIPAIGKLVNVMFFQNDLYDPYYMFSENYNINLQNKLKNLSDEEYVNFVALLFDERTQIYADSSELTIDHLFNKITINDNSINLELKDNGQTLNLGSKNSEQEAVLGTRFFEWMDRFIDDLSNPASLLDSAGYKIDKPKLEILCAEYKNIRSSDKNFTSKHVMITDNNSITKIDRAPKTDSRKNDVDLILSDNIDEQEALNKRTQAQNDAACERLKDTKSTNIISIDTTGSDTFGSKLPLEGDKISSRFGMRKLSGEDSKFHTGIDISASEGTTIVSPFLGIVIKSSVDTKGAGGNMIIIDHKNGCRTGYCHLSKYLVKINDIVEAGEPIGEVGNTGTHSFGAHLHFYVELSQTGERIDPETYFTWPVKPNDAPKKGPNNSTYQGQEYEIASTPCQDDSNDPIIGEFDSMEIQPGSLIFENLVTENKEAFIAKVKAISSKLQINPNDLMCVMWLESKINSHIVNPNGGATGLIQFMPTTAKSAPLNTTTEKLRNMSNVEQLDYVYKYFKKYTGKIKDFTTLYMIVFYPVSVGKPDNWIFGSEDDNSRARQVRNSNHGFDINSNGYITIAEFKQAIYDRLPKAERNYMLANKNNSDNLA